MFPFGLANFGSTCFLNSGIQLLLGTGIIDELSSSDWGSITCFLQSLQPDRFDPRAILLSLGCRFGEPQEFIEVFCNLLETLSRESEINKGVISRYFGSTATEIVQCTGCQAFKEQRNPGVFSINLDATNEYRRDVLRMINEELGDVFKGEMFCDVCRTKTVWFSRTNYDFSKYVLFSLNRASGEVVVSPRLALPGLEFKAAAIVYFTEQNQSGFPARGHYFVVSERSGDWFKIDDLSIEKIPGGFVTEITTPIARHVLYRRV